MRAQFNNETKLLEVLNTPDNVGNYSEFYVRNLTESEQNKIKIGTGDRKKIWKDTENEISAVIDPSPIPVPTVVDLWKLKAVLELAGKTEAINAAIESLPFKYRVPAHAGWENASTIQRKHPLVTLIIAVPELNITEADINLRYI